MKVKAATVLKAPSEKEPVFSVIIPVYLAESYLSVCLDSVLEQDFSDIEVICINDGSTDGSREILGDYARRDERVKIIDQANAGPSAARNAGIQAARGDYLMFLDSDDYLEPVACSTLNTAFELNDADVITFGAKLYPPNSGNDWLERQLVPQNRIYSGFEPQLLFGEKSHPYACRSVFRRSFFVRCGLSFDESLHLGEDELLYFLAYPQSGKTVLLSDKLYNYRALRGGSLTAERQDEALLRIRDHFLVVERILSGWEKLSLLEVYTAELLEWVVEFLTYDIATQGQVEQAALLGELNAILAPYLKDQDLKALKLMHSSRSILLTILQAPDAVALHISWFQLQRYRLARRIKLFLK